MICDKKFYIWGFPPFIGMICENRTSALFSPERQEAEAVLQSPNRRFWVRQYTYNQIQDWIVLFIGIISDSASSYPRHMIYKAHRIKALTWNPCSIIWWKIITESTAPVWFSKNLSPKRVVEIVTCHHCRALLRRTCASWPHAVLNTLCCSSPSTYNNNPKTKKK